ncbi:MAG: hypothetical protein LBB24_02510 [Rickettsiales bacterium]|jgi:hypothetical protein|nr:hypothetical protein [Rickettsiales bacterium]
MILRRLKDSGEFNSYDLLKNIAFFTMLVDHAGLFVFGGIKLLRVIGRTSAPIYAFLFGTNRKKKMDRVALYAILLSIVQAHFYNSIFPLNILYSFYISNLFTDRLSTLYSTSNTAFFSTMVVLLLLGELSGNLWEYGTYFTALIFCGRICRKSEKTLRDKILMATIFLIFFCSQVAHMSFGIVHSLFLFLIFSILYVTFIKFKPREFKNVPCRDSFMFISRYSVELFFFQHVIFMIISIWLYWTTGKI